MEKYDVIVTGAGAAGMMAAGRAAELGARTLLLEKMNTAGRKVRITGKGRCNLTNTAPLAEFVSQFGKQGRFLRTAFSGFFSSELVAFFSERGLRTVEERGGRVFPENNDARQIVEVLLRWLKETGVEIRTGARVLDLEVKDSRISGVLVQTGAGTTRIQSDAVIVTTGGASYPGTGSSGDGYALAEKCGHSVVPIRPALVPVETSGPVAKQLQGVALRNVGVSIWINDKKMESAFGELMFTHFGLSGPTILTLSKHIVDYLRERQKPVVSIDLKPALDFKKLDARLLRDIEEHGKKKSKVLLKGLLPQKMVPVCSRLTGIPEDKRANQISSSQRKLLLHWLKDFRFEVTRSRPFTEAIVTAGGVDTAEINKKTMESKIVNGLYFAGEVIDIDGTTGGYNLQAAFSTGWLAGQSASSNRHDPATNQN
jgi:predicted Rossmann fold flavoprotein